MRLLEYQAKQLFSQAGSRGKRGGVLRAQGPSEAASMAARLLGARLEGLPIERLTACLARGTIGCEAARGNCVQAKPAGIAVWIQRSVLCWRRTCVLSPGVHARSSWPI